MVASLIIEHAVNFALSGKVTGRAIYCWVDRESFPVVHGEAKMLSEKIIDSSATEDGL